MHWRKMAKHIAHFRSKSCAYMTTNKMVLGLISKLSTTSLSPIIETSIPQCSNFKLRTLEISSTTWLTWCLSQGAWVETMWRKRSERSFAAWSRRPRSCIPTQHLGDEGHHALVVWKCFGSHGKTHGNLGENHGKQSWNWHKTCG